MVKVVLKIVFHIQYKGQKNACQFKQAQLTCVFKVYIVVTGIKKMYSISSTRQLMADV